MHKHFANIGWVYLSTFLVIPVTYGIRVLYARELSLEDFGVFYGLFGFFTLFGFLRNWGMNNAVIYFANKYHTEARIDKIKTLYWFNQIVQFGLSIIVGYLLFLLKEHIFTAFYPTEKNISSIFNVFILYWITFTIYSTNSIFLTIFENQKANAILNVLYFSIILLISILFFSWQYNNFIIPVLAYLAGSISIVLISSVYILTRYKKTLLKPEFYLKKDLYAEVFKYSNSIIIAGLASSLFFSTDKIVIQYFEDAEKVALYAVGFSTALLLTLFVDPLQRVLQPILANKWHLKKIKAIEIIMSSILNNYLMLILPLVLSFFIFADNFVIAVYGEQFLPASLILKVLVLCVLIITINSFHGIVLSSIGKPKTLSKIVVISGIGNLTLSILLINIWGILGVAIATIVSSIIKLFLLFSAVRKIFSFKIDLLNNLKIIFSSLLFLASSLFLKNTIYQIYTDKLFLNFLINCLIIFCLSSVVYIIALKILKIITREKIKFFYELVWEKNN